MQNVPPIIDGTPPATASVGATYSFLPTASDADGNLLSFSIANKPVWATFDTTTGRLSGTPASDQVGIFAAITISVSDGYVATPLSSFSITVDATAPVPVPAVGAPIISGTPLATVLVGGHYDFLPSATDPSGGAMTFSIQNMPSWATFDPATGELVGVPTAANVGTSSHILISVSDGHATAALTAFSITVNQIETGSATISWVPPTENADGTALTNLGGYRIYYGRDQNALNQKVEISKVGITKYVVTNLAQATWYFSITSYSLTGTESALSGVISTVIN